MLLVSFWGGFIIKVLAYYCHISHSPKKGEKKKRGTENGTRTDRTTYMDAHTHTSKKLAKSTKTSNNPIGFGTSKTAGYREKSDSNRFIHE